MSPIPVIAGIVRNEQGRILLCQRGFGNLEGLWEFPGGKIEQGETPEQCLEREIKEELDLVVHAERVYRVVHASYDHGDFLLIAYLASYQSGTICLKVHSDARWVPPEALPSFPLADANIPIAKALKEETNASRTGMSSNGGADDGLDGSFRL